MSKITTTVEKLIADIKAEKQRGSGTIQIYFRAADRELFAINEETACDRNATAIYSSSTKIAAKDIAKAAMARSAEIADSIDSIYEDAEESAEQDELTKWAIGEVCKVVHQFAPGVVIGDRTKIFDLLPAGEERDSYEEELCGVMCRIYRKAANEEYMSRTSSDCCDTNGYGSDWDGNCYGTEWKTIWDCIACGYEAADAVLEEEREAEED
ncbi:hypothetical protein [uncultured Victivallis sp.]|uniref:hypothetical protein n=1 Tax=uncultured Victivallis sp. TaxID=354118 RepID=UPI002598CC03|nr:hypothetical protein [uncultured Victivallis sp.]